MNKLKVFTAFAGYGGDKFALQLANIDYEEIGFSEIDKYAIQCHEQNHSGENFGSITDIDPDDIPDFDLFTGGFPCQAFSIAGKGQGVNDDKGRGLLFNHIIRICEVKKPKYILLENVKGLTSKKHKEFFEFTKSELKRIGYNIDVSLFNSKNYGIPQNRERVFYVCIRNDLEFKYDKPIPTTQTKKMKTLNSYGEVIPNTPHIGQAKRVYDEEGLLPSLNVGWTPLVLKDLLEDTVEDKYFLSEKGVNGLLNTTFNTRKALLQKTTNCNTLLANDYKEPKCVIIHPLGYNKYIDKRVYGVNGISPAQNCYEQYKILLIKNARQGDGISLEQPNSKTRRGRVQEQISPTLQCGASKGVVTQKPRIRKLTPKECFRLMGFLKDQINLEGLSNTQKYKLAGNGWEINVVSKIMRGFLR